MSDRKYIGITIGPILQTLEEAGTPAALWFARFDQKNLSGAYDTYGRHTDIFTVLFRNNSG